MANIPEKKTAIYWKCESCGYKVVNQTKPLKCPNPKCQKAMVGPYTCNDQTETYNTSVSNMEEYQHAAGFVAAL